MEKGIWWIRNYLSAFAVFDGAELAVIVGYPVTMVLPTVFWAITL